MGRDVETEEATRIGPAGRIAAGLLLAVLGLISCLFAGLGFSDSLSSNTAGRVVLVSVFGAIGLGCFALAVRLVFNRPRRDGGLMSPFALRLTAMFFFGIPVISLATGAWRNNHLGLTWVLVMGVIYFSWGVALLRLASTRSRTSRSRSDRTQR